MMVCARIILIDLPFSMILRVFPNENQRNITIQRFRSFLFLEHSNMIGIGFSICSSRFPSSLPTHQAILHWISLDFNQCSLFLLFDLPSVIRNFLNHLMSVLYKKHFKCCPYLHCGKIMSMNAAVAAGFKEFGIPSETVWFTSDRPQKKTDEIELINALKNNYNPYFELKLWILFD